MSQNHTVDTPLTAKSKETTTFTSTPDNHTHPKYDDNLSNDDEDDDDWIDMQASTTFTQGHRAATATQDDHLVPTGTGDRSGHSQNKAHLDPRPRDTLTESASSLLSLPSDYGLESCTNTTSTNTAAFPLSLQVPSIDQQHPLGLDEDSIPGSATSSNSESEYSLLNPSSDQSRKNSLTGISGFHALTPTHSHTDTSSSPAITDDQLSLGSSQQDDDDDDDQDDEGERDIHQPPSIGVTSPSFSDFVQVESDQGDDFSLSPRLSSGNQMPSPISFSEASARMEDASSHENDDILKATTVPAAAAVDAEGKATETKEGKNDSDRTRGIQEVLHSVTSNQGENASSLPPPTTTPPAINTPSFATQSPPISTSSTTTTTQDPTQQSPPLPSIASPIDRSRYRTTVEDAKSSSEEEREVHVGSGMRYRGVHDRHDDRDDIRNSFFGTARATSTMPGGLNLGLDADIDHFSHNAPQPAAVPFNDPPVDERQCRICLGGADEEDTLGRLISPCLCKGSMKYVHIECLNAWRTRSPKPESHYKCDTCKYAFSFRRTSFARYLGHPLTVFALTIIAFVLLVFAAGFAMKLLLYLTMDESQEFIYPADLDEEDLEVMRVREDIVIFKTPESLRAVFQIDKTHMVFGSFFVSIIGFLQLFVSVWMGGGGGIFRIGGFGLGGGGRRRGGRGERQGEAGVGGVLMVVVLVFGLFKSVYMTYQFVNRMSRRVLAKAEMMVLEVQA
ncbi:MAG: hypothetical protein JOS17DRAFT_379520 [Linnemannia elongata]|nr:MAG: hypothetical protein JOS17DRAFT_379520 [Linnemannia elongata]